jgi:predicted NAD-dependent protein-ADP-ribosyltransferase YbiA (DUF1768 family)
MAVETKISEILYLHNTDQIPFGKLSPLYREKLKINGEESSNVISYCYASLLNKGGRRNAILLENGKDARTEALKHFREEKNELYSETMYNGLFEKIKQNTRARDNLLKSGESIIIYQSENIFLGVNAAGQGENRLGNMLMKIRTVFQKQFIEDNKKKFFELVQLGKYNIYIVYKSLKEKLLNGLDDLSTYIGKMPDQIISELNLSPFPGKFDIEFPKELVYFFSNPTFIAESLRNQYGDDYNEKILDIKKNEILRTFLVKNAIQSLPENSENLYIRYKQLKDNMETRYRELKDIEKGYRQLKDTETRYTELKDMERYNQEINEEFKMLSAIFRPIVSEIGDFIEKLGPNISELEDRLYFLASNNMLPGISAKITKPKIVIPEEYIQNQREYRDREQIKILEALKEYKQKKDEKDPAKLKEIQEKIEIQKQLYKEVEEKFYHLEKKYMKEAAKIAEKEYMRQKGLDTDSESESESESENESESDSELEISEKLQKLYQKYKQNYKNIYQDIERIKRYLKNKVEIDKLLEEYNKSLPKRPFVWKKIDPLRDKNYVFTASDEVMLDEALNQIVPIKKSNKRVYKIPELPVIDEDKRIQKLPVKRGSVKRDEKQFDSVKMSIKDKESLFESLLKYSSKQDDLKEFPLLAESLLSSSKQKAGSVYRFSDQDPLSPSFLDFLEINHFVFPNIYYYIYFKILTSVAPSQDQIMLKTYSMLLINPEIASIDMRNFKSIDELSQLYSNFENFYISDKLTKAAEKALHEKFRFRHLTNLPKDKLNKVCKLLIASYPKLLIYNDSDDTILGFSKQQGFNIIGRIMTDIREELLSKYGPIGIDEFKEELEERRERKSKAITEFIQDKIKEFLYVFSIYVDYIKNDTHIKDEDVSFIIDKIYKNCSLKIKKIIEDLKNIPPMPSFFERQSSKFLQDYNYTINKGSLQKLWSYIYILNELYSIEIVDNYIDLFDTKKTGSFGTTIDLGDVNWFISSVKKLKDQLGNVDISLGLNYDIDGGKKGSITINRKNIYDITDKNLEDYYNNTIMKILTLLQTDTESVKNVFITVYESPISIIRQRYIKQKERLCSKLIDINTDYKEKQDKLNCVLDCFIIILKKLKKNNLISEKINDSILLFINRLLSISGSIDKGVKIKYLSTYEKKEEEDQLYEASLSLIIKELFRERGFVIDNIDNAIILLKNIAYHPNYNDVMARVLSFSEQEESDLAGDTSEFIREYKQLLREDKEPKKKRITDEDDDEEEEEEEESSKKKSKKKEEDEDSKKKSKKRITDEEDEDEEEEEDGEEGYDIDFQYNDESEEDEEGEEDLLFEDE